MRGLHCSVSSAISEQFCASAAEANQRATLKVVQRVVEADERHDAIKQRRRQEKLEHGHEIQDARHAQLGLFGANRLDDHVGHVLFLEHRQEPPARGLGALELTSRDKVRGTARGHDAIETLAFELHAQTLVEPH